MTRGYKTIKDALAGKWRVRDCGYVTPCHVWMAYIDRRGYGIIRYQGARYRAHCLSYIGTHGSIPEGHSVHHKCEIPYCINPRHLEAVIDPEHWRHSKNMRRYH